MTTVQETLVEGTGNPLVDNLIVEAILTAQRMNEPVKTAATDAVKALHAAILEWDKLVAAEEAKP